jgi:hypothetical protein
VSKIILFGLFNIENGNSSTVLCNIIDKSSSGVDLTEKLSTHPTRRSDLLTVNEVPMTRQRSAVSTASVISSRWCGISSNQTTPGRKRPLQRVQRGKSESKTCGVSDELDIRPREFASLCSRCPHEVQRVSNSRPCISKKSGGYCGTVLSDCECRDMTS